MLTFPSNSHYSEESKKVIQKHRGVEDENHIQIIQYQVHTISAQRVQKKKFQFTQIFAEIRCYINRCTEVSQQIKSAMKKRIPRRRKPVVQEQGHRVHRVQAEPMKLGQQKLDNQEWRQCLHNSG